MVVVVISMSEGSLLLLHLLAGSLADLLLALRVGLGVLPLLGLVVARVALDEGEGTLLAAGGSGEGDAADLGLEGDAAEVLLFVVLANGELIVCHIVPLQTPTVARGCLLEIIELLLECLLQVRHYLRALPL